MSVQKNDIKQVFSHFFTVILVTLAKNCNYTKQNMKILIIRFSSIGDVAQALSIPAFIHENLKSKSLLIPSAPSVLSALSIPSDEMSSETGSLQIHFVTRSEFAGLVSLSPRVKKVWAFEKKLGFYGLYKLIQTLNSENYDFIYDAHNNLRSNLICFFVKAKTKITKPMFRLKRFLLIHFKKNFYSRNFSGQLDLLEPLVPQKFYHNIKLPNAPVLDFTQFENQKSPIYDIHWNTKFIVIAPSATYVLKRWPLDYWDRLIQKNTDKTFVVLAGTKDDFTHELDHNLNVINLTGRTNLIESAYLIKKSKFLISNDTGLLHIAEQIGQNAIALMGPAPFGYPSRPTTQIFENRLKCWPCSKHGQGPCTNPSYQQCMTDTKPESIQPQINQFWNKD